MISRKNLRRMNLFTLSLSILIFCSTIITGIATSANYQINLSKGTDYFIVNKYDANAWNSTFMSSISTIVYFRGDSNVTGAERKVITKGSSIQRTENTYTLFSNVFFRGDQATLLLGLADFGYNETEINELYPTTYIGWFGLQTEWYFTKEEFTETPNQTSNLLIILKNPEQYKTLLDDYNNFVYQVKNNSAVPPPIKNVLSNYTADEFIFNLAFNGLTLATPTDQYLSTLVDSLNTMNTSYSTSGGSTKLIIEGYSKTSYTVEITYEEEGTMTQIEVKDAVETIIYKVTTYNEEWIFYTILFITIAILGVLIAFVIYRKIKQKR